MLERVAGSNRNGWRVWIGMLGTFGPEYAKKATFGLGARQLQAEAASAA